MKYFKIRTIVEYLKSINMDILLKAEVNSTGLCDVDDCLVWSCFPVYGKPQVLGPLQLTTLMIYSCFRIAILN